MPLSKTLFADGKGPPKTNEFITQTEKMRSWWSKSLHCNPLLKQKRLDCCTTTIRRDPALKKNSSHKPEDNITMVAKQQNKTHYCRHSFLRTETCHTMLLLATAKPKRKLHAAFPQQLEACTLQMWSELLWRVCCFVLAPNRITLSSQYSIKPNLWSFKMAHWGSFYTPLENKQGDAVA